MNANLEEIEQAVQKLSREERELLAVRILDGLDEEWSADEREAWYKAWEEEIERRYAAMSSGAIPTKSIDEVFSGLREKLR